jgi:hypothetical protein
LRARQDQPFLVGGRGRRAVPAKPPVSRRTGPSRDRARRRGRRPRSAGYFRNCSPPRRGGSREAALLGQLLRRWLEMSVGGARRSRMHANGPSCLPGSQPAAEASQPAADRRRNPQVRPLGWASPRPKPPLLRELHRHWPAWALSRGGQPAALPSPRFAMARNCLLGGQPAAGAACQRVAHRRRSPQVRPRGLDLDRPKPRSLREPHLRWPARAHSRGGQLATLLLHQQSCFLEGRTAAGASQLEADRRRHQPV